MTVYRILVVLTTIFIFTVSIFNANAAVNHNAEYEWFTIESTHFRVHYYTAEKQLATQAINIAERVHNNLSAWIQWQPDGKTDLVLSDEFDVSNGSATPFPGNRINLIVSPPDTVSSLEDHASWLETLITHEYLHILHLDKAINWAATWRNTFGRIPFFLFNTFPASSLPNWGVEGLATYIETDEQRGIGRGQSSYFDMLMRLEVANGIKPIHQVNQRISSWPMGTSSYLYGVNYYQFIEYRYGAKSVNALVNDYSATLFPYRINHNTEDVLNKNLVVLWDEFDEYLQNKHSVKIKSITDQGIKAGNKLTDNGYFDSSLTALADGRVFYVSYDAQRNAALMMKVGNKITKLVRVEVGTRIDVHSKAGVLLAQPTLCENSQYFYDLYQVDIESGSLNQLTQCARYRTATWSPDGSKIIAVHNELAKNTIVVLDSKGNKLETLWHGTEWQVVSNIDWSPDGNSLVAAVYREASGWNIEQFNLKKKQWLLITNNSVIQQYPSYSFDGNNIYYSAEYDGVYNIFKQSLKTKKITQLSNVLGAAFYPVEVSSQGDVAYIGHNTIGMDIYQLVQSEQLNQKITNSKKISNQPTGVALTPAPSVKITEPTEYSPWSSVRPRWWYPLLAFGDDISLVGISTSSTDVLTRHQYVTTIAYDSKNKLGLGSFDYIYDRYWPIFKFHYDRSINILYGTDDKFARTKVSDVTQIETILPFLGLQQRLSAHFVFGNETVNDARRAAGIPKAKEFSDKYYGASLVYNSAKQHPRGISRNEGRQVMLTVEDSSAFKESFYKGSVTTFDWREFVPLGGAHVLGFRVVSGRGEKDSKPFQLGGFSNTTFVPPLLRNTLVSSPFNRRAYNLRGYSNGQFIGNNTNVISAEYRFPLFKLERGFMTPPIGLYELHAAVFYDSGATWNNNKTTPEKYYSGSGVEITAVTTLFFNTRLNIVLGFSKGHDKILGESTTYLRLGSSF